MIEITPGVNEGANQAERFSSVLIAEISEARGRIGKVKGTGAWLTDDGYQCIKDIHTKIDTNLLTLLTLRRGTEMEHEISVQVEMFPGESIHSFSDNRIVVGVPSPKYPGSIYRIYASLSDLRGPNVSNSVEAMEVIGESSIAINQNRGAFFMKMARELARINNEIALVKKGESKYSLAQLNRLVEVLNEQRRLALENLR